MTTKTTQLMTALLPVKETLFKGVKSYHVDGRALHGFLESKRDFSNWINQRIKQYGFIENEDYRVVCSTNLLSKAKQKSRGGHNKIDYWLSLNMAKELEMVENNPQGKQARRYFIRCEEQLSQIAPEIHQQELTRWQQCRELAKNPFKAMNNALERMRTRQGKATNQKHYINETNMISGIVLGKSVQRFKAERDIQGDVRAHLTAIQLEQLEYLERANEMLLDSDVTDFEERRFKLQAMLNNRFKPLRQAA